MDDEKIKRSLRFSFLDGVFASCMIGFTQDFLTPYALALKATVRQIGLLNSVPNLVASLFQLKSADVTQRLASRKKIINVFVFLHALMLVPILSIPYVFRNYAVSFLIIFITLFATFGAFAAGAWSSLISDHVPPDKRGQYFGWRNRILGFISVVASFLAGFILQRSRDEIFKGFLVILSLACICRFISWYFLTRMYEPPLKISSQSQFSFFDFIKRIRESNFAKFVFFVAGLNFSVNLASPYFVVLMLRDLKFSYLTYTIITLSATVAHLSMIDRWGKQADKIGNIRIIKFTSFFIAFVPFFWIIHRHPLYLILVQVFSGFAWSGFNLCASNFIYDAVSPEKRTRCVSYFNVINGSALCAGALGGGWLAFCLPPLLGYRILSLFLISTVFRFIVVSLFSHKIKEVRPVVSMSSRDLFYSVVGIKPVLGIFRETLQVLRKEE